MENKKDQCLKTAADCFVTVNAHNAVSENTTTSTSAANCFAPISVNSFAGSAERPTNGTPSADDSHDEKWLYHYMLGKVAEKRKEQPDAVIAHYIESAKCLYEHNASFPFKISHSNPQHLSVEALEVYYRITALIVKYLEQHATVSRTVGRLFIRVLREVNSSPFALNQAKIDGHSINALKRKISIANDAAMAKRDKIEEVASVEQTDTCEQQTKESTITIDSSNDMIVDETKDKDEDKSPPKAIEISTAPNVDLVKTADPIPPAGTSTEENLSPSRRGSQESNITATTTGTATTATTTTGTSDTSSSSSSDSSSDTVSSDDSDDDSTEEDTKVITAK